MSGIKYFSGFEVIRAAKEVEKNGHRFYSSMVERTGNALIKELFGWLAQDEVEHLRRLKKLEEKFDDDLMWADDEFLPYLNRFKDSEIFPTAERLEQVLAEQGADLKVLDLAIEAEENFAAYFRKAEENARTDDGKEAFAWLAGEEERHARIIRERREKLSGR